MEDNPEFFETIKKLQYYEEIETSNTLGVITNIEQVEYMTFKLSIKIGGNVYCGIYLEYNNKMYEIKENDFIKLFMMNLVKKERKIYLYTTSYHKKGNINCENNIQDEINLKSFDLNPSSLIQTLSKNTDINYQKWRKSRKT